MLLGWLVWVGHNMLCAGWFAVLYLVVLSLIGVCRVFVAGLVNIP